MKTCDGTEKAFGFEWNIYREIIPLHERQFANWINPVPLSFFKGKRFMDAGCGIGRNSLWAMKAGASSGYAFDYDERTIHVARENLKAYASCEVAYRSIYGLDFVDEFDIVFCTGVLQHLELPKAAVKKLVDAIKPGGTLIIWVYAREGNEWYLLWSDPLRRRITSRINPTITRYLSKFLTALLKIYLMFPHRDIYLNELKRRSFRHTEAMVFDQLIPATAHYWRKDEVLDLVEGLPVDMEHITHTLGMSWTLVAKKRCY